jgi:hypothetical protein
VCVCACVFESVWLLRKSPHELISHVAVQAAGAFQGHAVYGIRTLTVHAPRLRSIVEDCALAAKSADARDKYFETYVGAAAPGASKALRSELPSLEAWPCFHATLCGSMCVCVCRCQAARASVATVVSELGRVLPQISSCRGAASLIRAAGLRTPVRFSCFVFVWLWC